MNYYSDKIMDITLRHAKELTGHNEILPSHNDPNILANDLVFVKKIRDGITIDLSKSPPSETRHS